MITEEAIPAADKILAVAIIEQAAAEIIAVPADATIEQAEVATADQAAEEIIAAAAEVLIIVTAIIAAADLRKDIRTPLTLKGSRKNILRASDLFDAFFIAY